MSIGYPGRSDAAAHPAFHHVEGRDPAIRIHAHYGERRRYCRSVGRRVEFTYRWVQG